MEHHPVEDRPLRMPRTIHSRHGGKNAPRNRPMSWIRPHLPEKTLSPPPRTRKSIKKTSTGVVAQQERQETTGDIIGIITNEQNKIKAWTQSDPKSPDFRWTDAWEDGHYVILIGVEGDNLVFENPSLLGTRGYIPCSEFLGRWRDYEGEPP